MLLLLAMRVSCAAHSRTCATEPGAEVSCSEYTVWIESITTTSGFSLRDGRLDLFQLDLRQQVHAARIQRQALGAQRDLLRRFLAADIQHFFVRREMRQRLQQQRGFADAGIAADQHHRALHQPAAQHAVELDDAGGRARHFCRFDFGEHLHLAARRQRAEAVLAARRHLCHALHQRVPRIAMRALPLPLRHLPAAFGAGIDRFCFCHTYLLIWLFGAPEKMNPCTGSNIC